MIPTRNHPFRYLPKLHSLLQCRYVSDPPKLQSPPSNPIDPRLLLRVCTILYQQQNAPDTKLFSNLRNVGFYLTHEFFLQVCNRFPFSWKPIHRFFHFSLHESYQFPHSPIIHNKILDIYGKSSNTQLFWDFLRETADKRLVTVSTLRIAAKSLAVAKEMKKCVEFFKLMHAQKLFDGVESLDVVVQSLCSAKLVAEARYLVLKLKSLVKPSATTHGFLVSGFCEVCELVDACKVWNLMVDEGLEPEVASYEKMMDAFFKCNRISDAKAMFGTLKLERYHDMGLSSYRLLISWLCRKGKLVEAHMVFGEMLKRGIGADNEVFASLVYGVVSRGAVREGYKIVQGIRDPDLSVYHGLMKGLLRQKRAREATQVFREMVERGCEPTMHTYIMLLQGHLGKRGRKGPDPLVNFESIFVGGLVKLGKSLEATKYLERMMNGGIEVPRFDYNRFLHCFSNEEGIFTFEEVGKKLKEVGLVDLADILVRYGEKMATRERRRRIKM
eukprot:TRINITY_DN3490_c0_g1_i5.p1 TRINITY_DN3490_c0_g1~~TRINITY_DN3490_c0_g1_i5.p1  ORF type:complete len:499 (+),score=89.54 TRINITY_DN3490_c0_g1_i5:985-2481(+)